MQIYSFLLKWKKIRDSNFLQKDSPCFESYVYVRGYQIVMVTRREADKRAMWQSEKDLGISRALVDWYKVYKRELPWRETGDPYLIWISEVILQQTRVAQGLAYFNRFRERFPDVASLASADEDEVLRYWQGLGYYSRARNLHAAAKEVMERFGGVFPSAYKDVLSLKGIGEYTAAAIVSFAWNQPYPVVDGNVYRVLARLFAVDTPIDSTEGKRLFAGLAGTILDPECAGIHNQAIMELGALRCVPQNPDCEPCPLRDKCMAFAAGNVSAYPVKRNKTKSRDRYFNYLYIIYKERTWLNRRSGKDIWTGLYEFPLIETDRAMDFSGLSGTEAFRDLLGDAGSLSVTHELLNRKHVLSHQVLYASFYRIEIERVPASLDKYISLPRESLGRYAVPRLVEIYLEWLADKGEGRPAGNEK